MHVRLPAVVLALLALGLVVSGCLGPTGDDDSLALDDAPDPAWTPMPDVEKHGGILDVSVATAVISVNNGDAYQFALPRGDNLTGYVLELTWVAARPIHEELDLWVRHEGAGVIPPADPLDPIPEEPIQRVTGASPLRLAFTADGVPDDRPYEILVRAATPLGVVVEQPFTLHVATFVDIPFDDTWTSLE